MGLKNRIINSSLDSIKKGKNNNWQLLSDLSGIRLKLLVFLLFMLILSICLIFLSLNEPTSNSIFLLFPVLMLICFFYYLYLATYFRNTYVKFINKDIKRISFELEKIFSENKMEYRKTESNEGHIIYKIKNKEKIIMFTAVDYVALKVELTNSKIYLTYNRKWSKSDYMGNFKSTINERIG